MNFSKSIITYTCNCDVTFRTFPTHKKKHGVSRLMSQASAAARPLSVHCMRRLRKTFPLGLRAAVRKNLFSNSRNSAKYGSKGLLKRMGAAASALNEQDKSEISVQLKAKYEELSSQSLSEVEIYSRMNE